MAPTRIVGDCCCGGIYPVSIEITSVEFDHVRVYYGEFGEEDEVSIFEAYARSPQPIIINGETHYSDGSVVAREYRVPNNSYSASSAFYYKTNAKTLVFLLPVIETTVNGKTYRTVPTTLTRTLYGRTDRYPSSAYWIITFTDSDATQTGTEDGYPIYADIPWEVGAEENYSVAKHTALFEVYEPEPED